MIIYSKISRDNWLRHPGLVTRYPFRIVNQRLHVPESRSLSRKAVDFMRNNQRHYLRTPKIFFRNVKLYVLHDKPAKEENGANISRIVMLAGSIILGL